MPLKYDIERDRENGSGIFYAYWRENGRQKRKSLKTKDEVEAQKALGAILQASAEQPEERKGAALILADLWPVYMAKKIRGSASEEGASLAWKLLERHFGRLTVPQIDQNAADKYVELRTSGKLGRKVQAQTVRKELTYVIACLNFCGLKKYGQKMFDPNTIEPINRPEHGAPRDRWLRDHEIDALHAAARHLRRGERMSRIERFLYLGLHTAGREQALYDLTWDRVDFDIRVIDLRVPGRRKGKRRASVPISDDLLVVLRQARAEAIGDLVLDNKSSLWKSLQLVTLEAGLAPNGWQKAERHQSPSKTGVSPHVLRHTAATHMARGGVPLWKIANILGNTLAVVESTYATFCPDEQSRAAVNVMSRGVRAVQERVSA